MSSIKPQSRQEIFVRMTNDRDQCSGNISSCVFTMGSKNAWEHIGAIIDLIERDILQREYALLFHT